MDNSNHPSGSTSLTGLALLTFLVGIAAVWLFFQAPSARPTQQLQPALDSTAAAGFRTEQWFLPDTAMLGFVEVPAGPFLMGSNAAVDTLAFDNERWSSDHAQQTVELPTFYIGQYEVTVAQFRAFVSATNFRVDPQMLESQPNHPVTSVSWPDALAYCRWLETALKESPETPAQLRDLLHDRWRIGLPSEAEWEKAARGTDGRIYPWGDRPRQNRANYAGKGTTPVGSFDCPDCTFGLSDISGNVWEWTRSPYQPYPYTRTDNVENLDRDALWVMRGGSFIDSEQNIRAAVRGGADPGARRPFIGFRLVLSHF